MSDIYVVLDGTRVVMASTSLQGAENIRADEAMRIATRLVGGRAPGLPLPCGHQPPKENR